MSITGERLSALMKENGYNPNSLAGKIGVSPSAIRKWVSADGDVVLSNLLKIADLFDCSIDYIAGRSDDDGKCGFKNAPNFGEQLRKVISESGKSVYDICKHTTFKWQCFSDWFGGKQPKLSSLIKLADYFDCTIDGLVGRE